MSSLHYEAFYLLKTFTLPRMVCIVRLHCCGDPAQDKSVREWSHGMQW